MSQKEIQIFQLQRTVVDRAEVQKWLTALGSEHFVMPEGDVVSDPALLIALAGKRCYMSFEPGLNPNVTKVRSDYVDYFDNIMSSGHGSVCEHSVYTFAIEGVTRVFTAEMNRHRAGWAISEASMRYIRFEKDIPWWLPLSLRPNDTDDEDLAQRKQESRAVFERVFGDVQHAYSQLAQIWNMDDTHHNFNYKKQVTSCMRRIVPLGVCTGGIWTGNIRALRHVFNMRCAPAAEEEICYVFSRIVEKLVKQEPLLFGDFAQDDNGFWRPKYAKI